MLYVDVVIHYHLDDIDKHCERSRENDENHNVVAAGLLYVAYTRSAHIRSLSTCIHIFLSPHDPFPLSFFFVVSFVLLFSFRSLFGGVPPLFWLSLNLYL